MLVDIDYLRARHREIAAAGDIAIDTEATGPSEEWSRTGFIDECRAVLHGMSVAWGDQAVYVPACPEIGPFLSWVGGLPGRVWMHNAHFDLRVFCNFLGSYPYLPHLSDTMVLAHRMGMGVPKGDGSWGYGLKVMVKHHLGHTMTEFDDLLKGMESIRVGWPDEQAYLDAIVMHIHETEQLVNSGKRLTKKRDQAHAKHLRDLAKSRVFRAPTLCDADPEEVARYAADDARQTLRLSKVLMERAVEASYVETFDRVDMPLVWVVRQMQDAGIAVDRAHFEALKERTSKQADALAQEWQTLVGCDIQSSRQCADRLFTELKWFDRTDLAKTATGAWSVNKRVLAHEMATKPPESPAYRAAALKAEHSRAFKLATAYTDSILGQLPYRDDGRLRSHIRVTGTDTGRFAMNGPNLMAMPREDVRAGLTAGPGMVLVGADWAGLELAVAAHYSQDPVLLRVVCNGESQHTLTAQALGIERHTAKVFNFAMQYGAGPRKIAITLGRQLVGGKAPDDIVALWEKWRETYAGLMAFSEKAAAVARARGYVKTLLGRRRYLPDIHSTDRVLRGKAERQAGNTVIQGTAADIANAAMVELNRRLATMLEARIILQIHDEIIVECAETDGVVVAQMVKQAMEETTVLRVPLKAEVKVGKTWAETK
jgi:DNA polymerase I-like protein with 3'-5' exonuclease and polymerase domains